MVYSFSSDLAKLFGINEATFLQILYDVILRNRNLCIEDGGILWFPCAIKEWEYYIDLWTYRQTDRIVKNCLNSKALFLRHYDDDERRRRGWYGINPDISHELESVSQRINMTSL